MKQLTINAVFSSTGGDGGGQEPTQPKKLKPLKFLANKDKLLQGRGREMVNALIAYMEEHGGPLLEQHTQLKLTKVLWKVSWGFAPSNKECKIESGQVLE